MNHLIMWRHLGMNVAHFIEPDDHPWFQHESYLEFLHRVGREETPTGLEYFIVSAKVIPYTLPNGSCAVVHPVPDGQFQGETFADFLLRCVHDSVPARCPYSIVDHVDIPHSRRLRKAWRHVWPAGRIDVDLNAARAVLIEHARMESTYWLREFDPLISRVGRLADFGEQLYSLTGIVADEVQCLDIQSLTDYQMPFPEVPQELQTPAVRDRLLQAQRLLLVPSLEMTPWR